MGRAAEVDGVDHGRPVGRDRSRSTPFASATATRGSDSIVIPARRPSSIAAWTFVRWSAVGDAGRRPAGRPAAEPLASYVVGVATDEPARAVAAAAGSSTAPGAATTVGAVPAGARSRDRLELDRAELRRP